MKALLLAVAIVTCPALSVPPAEGIWRAKGLSAYDGDTFTASIEVWPAPQMTSLVRVRIKGIDTPEIRGACETDKAGAIRAREALSGIIAAGSVWLSSVEDDPYPGRVDACVYDSAGRSVGDRLIDLGVAKPMGKKRVGGWCP